MAIVVVTDHVFPDLEVEQRLLTEAGHELRYEGDLRDAGALRAALSHADAVLNCYVPIPADLLAGLERCRIIARYGIGLDTLDVSVATEHGILVTNVPDYCIDEVSDHALALIMSLARGVVRLDRSVRDGSWSPMVARPLHRIRGRTLGLLGFGRIARALAAKGQALGYRVISFDPYVPAVAMTEVGVEAGTMEEVLGGSDVVSIHVPLTDETHHLIGADALARMRPDAVLVNTSRGPLVDLEALRVALAEGRLGGAALDVLDPEPPAADDPLLHRDDVVITPHAAFYSEEALAELQRKAVEQVVAALAGETPPYLVNPEAMAGGAR
jgi:D-3-phosphoglycerate dehydrogenase